MKKARSAMRMAAMPIPTPIPMEALVLRPELFVVLTESDAEFVPVAVGVTAEVEETIRVLGVLGTLVALVDVELDEVVDEG